MKEVLVLAGKLHHVAYMIRPDGCFVLSAGASAAVVRPGGCFVLSAAASAAEQTASGLATETGGGLKRKEKVEGCWG